MTIMSVGSPPMTAANETRALRVHLDSSPKAMAAAEARHRVRDTIRAWNIPVDPDAAELVTSELVTNALMHVADGKVTLAIRCTGEFLRIDVYDSSPVVPVAEKADPERLAEGGRGLAVVAAFATAWGTHPTPGGKAVYATFSLHGAE
jgi:anti-sigma regulatory factor (Ser/Thr protein kinase)